MENKIEEKIINVPNIITLLRVIGTPFLVYVLFSGFSDWFKAVTFLVFALSDMLDGFIARHFNQKTNFGAKFDMFADRLFFTTVILCIFIKIFLLAENSIVSQSLLPSILAREIIALPIAVYMFIVKTPFLKAKWTGKITTFTQGAAVASFLFGFSFTPHLFLLTGLVGVAAGLHYWRDSLEYLSKK
ncbi:CDP-alcohol phosphatidyltransferase family protein [Candidatus Falkowbacteria bacterium]|nr:CDP-alcohol phosphatidyltransferase family protein [Candidatus Falkowbacteria bacterium]